MWMSRVGQRRASSPLAWTAAASVTLMRCRVVWACPAHPTLLSSCCLHPRRQREALATPLLAQLAHPAALVP